MDEFVVGEYKTRDGRRAVVEEILNLDDRSFLRPISGIVFGHDGSIKHMIQVRWHRNGQRCKNAESGFDLVRREESSNVI